MPSVNLIDLAGVGSALSQQMNELGLFTTEDLLRTERRRLAAKVDGASIDQVRRWQAIAELLEVDGLTLPIAEGLYAAGIETLDELANRPLSTLRPVIETILTQQGVSSVAADDDLVNWMRDALVLRLTGTLNGTIVDADQSPVPGVNISCMSQRAVSDARGRFRLRRLPLGRKLLVSLEHLEYRAKTITISSGAPAGVLVNEELKLGRKRAKPTQPRVLSELNGDRLPSLSSAPIRTRAQDDAPAVYDILQVFEKLRSGEFRVISRLFDFDGTNFIIRTYRLAQNDLPNGVEKGDHLLYRSNRWQVVKLSSKAVDRYRRRIRERKQLPKLPADASQAEIQQFAEAWIEQLIQR